MSTEREAVQKVCGSLEVAQSLLERAALFYCASVDPADQKVLWSIAEARDLVEDALSSLQRATLHVVS